MGKATDNLIALAESVSHTQPGREMDMLITAGERKSIALVSMALHELGVPSESYTGSQAGFVTDVNHRNARIVDVRSPGRFTGSEPEPRPESRSGHIPASTNLHYATLIDGETRKLLAPDDLRARFEQAGLAGDGPFIASCGSGVTACIFALAKQVTGHDSVAVYDGSWTEWGRRKDLPLETGAAGDR